MKVFFKCPAFIVKPFATCGQTRHLTKMISGKAFAGLFVGF